MNTEAIVHHGVRVATHLARPNWMEKSAAGAATIVEQFIVGLTVLPWLGLKFLVRGEGRRFTDLACNLKPRHQCVSIDLFSEEIGTYGRRRRRISTLDMNRTGTFRSQLADGHGHTGFLFENPSPLPRRVVTRMGKVKLNIGCFEFRPGLDETMTDASGKGEHATASQDVLCRLPQHANSLSLLIQSNRLFYSPGNS